MATVVIYSKATSRVRRWFTAPVLPKDCGEHAGEASLVTGDDQDLNALQAQVSAVTGKTPNGDRYAIVDAQNNVVGVMLADPSCGDSIAGCQLIADPAAAIGSTYDPVTATVVALVFIPPVKTLSA